MSFGLYLSLFSKNILLKNLPFTGFHVCAGQSKKPTSRLDNKPVDEDIIEELTTYLVTFTVLFIYGILLVSIEGNNLNTSFSAVAATINNVGPILNIVGPLGILPDFNIILTKNLEKELNSDVGRYP